MKPKNVIYAVNDRELAEEILEHIIKDLLKVYAENGIRNFLDSRSISRGSFY